MLFPKVGRQQWRVRLTWWTVVSILVLGIVLLFIPGPGILVVLLGLSILAREYDWAEDLMHWARDRYRHVADRLKERSHSA